MTEKKELQKMTAAEQLSIAKSYFSSQVKPFVVPEFDALIERLAQECKTADRPEVVVYPVDDAYRNYAENFCVKHKLKPSVMNVFIPHMMQVFVQKLRWPVNIFFASQRMYFVGPEPMRAFLDKIE